MKKNSTKKVQPQTVKFSGQPQTIGLDLGDRQSQACVLNAEAEVVEQQPISTTRESLAQYFSARPPCRVILEVGTHSPWVSRLVQEFGHEVVVANAFRVKLIHKAYNKNDKRDAEFLARLGRADVKLLAPLRHRGERAQEHRALLSSRNCLVETRTKLINHVRGVAKALGERLPNCSTPAFADRVEPLLPHELRQVLEPLLKIIAELTARIKQYDRLVDKLAEEQYPETRLLMQVPGVGALTALAFVLTIEDPGRFAKSREVGPYLGLVPKKQDSGDSSPQLRITKAGDDYLRKLLLQAAHYILGPFGADSDLRRHGEKICERGGKNAKKRASVAVARKLAVLLHRLWVGGATYEPLYNAGREERAAESGGRSAELAEVPLRARR